MTLHQDLRTRMWECNDGRCFNISSSQLFASNFRLTQMETFPIDKEESQSARFLLCIGNCNRVSVIDLWKLELVKNYEIGSSCALVYFKIYKDSMTMEILSKKPFLSSSSYLFAYFSFLLTLPPDLNICRYRK